MSGQINPVAGKVGLGGHRDLPHHFYSFCGYGGTILEHPSHGIRRARLELSVFPYLFIIACGILSMNLYHKMVLHIKALQRPLLAPRDVDFYMVFHDIPCCSKALPRPLRAPRELIFHMVFHDIPCYSKALRRPLRAPMELIFILYSMIFHAIPRRSRDPCGHRGS